MEQNGQKTKRRFNVIDGIVVVLIIAALVFVGWKYTHQSTSEGGNTIHIDYTVRCENVANAVYKNCQEHLPSQLMASGKLFDGQIKSVQEQPYYVLSGNGEWVKDPEHVTLIFDVECNVPKSDVMTTKVGEQEVRVGKSDYILKSEYIELDKCVITNVVWDQSAS